ncbi:MAG: SLC13 family permease [Angelakisella sp.]
MKSTKRYLLTSIGCLFLFFFKFLPINIGLSQDAIQMLGIFIGAVFLWLTVGIDWTSILVLIALCLLPIATVNDIMASSLGNSVIAFLIFSFMLTYTLSETGFLKRCAVWFLSSNFARKGTWPFIISFFVAVTFIGCFISPTVTFLLFFAFAQQIFSELKIEKGHALGRIIMIGTAIITSISCAMTPIAHTFPLMAFGFYAKDTSENINYFSYMAVGIPVGIICIAITILMLWLSFRFSKDLSGIDTKSLTFEISPMTIQEKLSVGVFCIVVLMWILPGISKETFPVLNNLGVVFPALVGVALLSVVQIDGKPVLNFNNAITKGVSWPSIILCATTLVVGKYLTHTDLGITKIIGDTFLANLSTMSAFSVILIIVAVSIIMTNFMSNIVTVTVVYSIAMPLILSSSQVSPALCAALIGMASSCAYATPPAIAHIAIAAGCEWTTPQDMLKYGGIMALFTTIVIVAVASTVGIIVF